MASVQNSKPSLAHRFGFGLGQAVKRFRAAWFRMESNLVQRAGEHGALVKASLLVVKVLLGAAGLAAVLFAAFWIAVFVLGVLALVAFGGGDGDEEGFNSALDGFVDGGYYENGVKVYDYDE
ncbi:DUF3742 family protein [Pseudomonas sp. NCHU5208]|uniref:DUF3742 family protein n=1 Tax=unclassified Pseudomonas TaxID=196821 RepID=UPI003F9CF968